jgi:uroporphyrinogen-III synthase
MTRVVVLRPEPGASETIARAAERGLDAVAIPLFRIEPIEWRAPDAGQFDALVLTSANAVRFGGPGLAALRDLPVHAVGAATAAAARDAAIDVATVGDAGVEELIASFDPNLRILHLAGEHRAASSRPMTTLAVYRSRLVEAPEDLKTAEEAVVLIHSPRAGNAFAQAADRLGLDRAAIRIAAISSTAAEATGTGWAAIESAAQPTDDALLALAERLCEKGRGE